MILLWGITEADADVWRFADSKTDNALFTVSFADSLHGWAAGEDGIMLRTIDGGRNWTSGATYDDTFTEIASIDSVNAWASAFSSVWRTEDGATWEKVTDSLTGSAFTIVFVSQHTGWVGANLISFSLDTLIFKPVIWRTTDAGMHWDSTMLPVEGLIRDLYFLDDSIGWAGGEGWLASTTDGGTTWSVTDWSFNIVSLAFDAWPHVWIVGDGGEILYSSDGMMTFDYMHSPPNVSLWTASFNNCTGVLVGEEGALIVTQDGGNTWATENASTNHSLTAVSQPECDKIWIAGVGGSLITNDVEDPTDFLDSLALEIGDEWFYETEYVFVNWDTNWQPIDTFRIEGYARWSIVGSDTMAGRDVLEWHIFERQDNSDYTSQGWYENSPRGFYEVAYKNTSGVTDPKKPEENNYFIFAGRTFNSLLDLKDWIIFESFTGDTIRYRDPPRAVLTYPVNIHNRWVHFSDSFLSHRRISDVEDIIVPLGTYSAAGVRSLYPDFTSEDELEFIDWYASIGLVKREIHIKSERIDSLGNITGYYTADIIFERTDSTVVAIEDDYDRITEPMGFSLARNYPNPFNPITIISFTIPQTNEVQLTVYNILGEEVVRLVDSEMPAGNHSVKWNAADRASGVYIYKLQTDSHTMTRKMLLLK